MQTDRVYADTKRANLLFARELSRRLQPTGVTVNSFHPQTTELFGHHGPVGTATDLLLGLLAGRSREEAEDGARTAAHLCASPRLEGVTGRHFADCAPATTSRASRDAGTALRLWQRSAELLQMEREEEVPKPRDKTS